MAEMNRTRTGAWFGALCLSSALTASLLTACAGSKRSTADAGSEAGEEAHAAQPAPLGDTLPGLHNVFLLDRQVYSGSGPESPEAFDALAGIGVKTIISVDGARPDLELARERGLRYIHIPIGYDGMAPGQAEAIAKAVHEATAEGPVFVHCHHGLHRGPAAAAVAMVELGRMTNEQAASFMTAAGTSTSYPGLWACARDATPTDSATLDAMQIDLPEYQPVSGLIDGMVAIDKAWEHMKLVRAAQWRAPADHPDIAPAAEAGILADHFRVLVEDPDSRVEGAEFVAAMRLAAERASALEAAMAVPVPDPAAAEAAYKAVGVSCTDCHKGWRN
ncbi:MAG: cytochrome c [Phycisphaerales bacterium]|nr:cytochrome c [Phycisphaerales bacterium]